MDWLVRPPSWVKFNWRNHMRRKRMYDRMRKKEGRQWIRPRNIPTINCLFIIRIRLFTKIYISWTEQNHLICCDFKSFCDCFCRNISVSNGILWMFAPCWVIPFHRELPFSQVNKRLPVIFQSGVQGISQITSQAFQHCNHFLYGAWNLNECIFFKDQAHRKCPLRNRVVRSCVSIIIWRKEIYTIFCI